MSDFLTTRNFLLSPGEAQATDPVVMRHGICECVGAAVVEVWRVLPQRPLPESRGLANDSGAPDTLIRPEVARA